MKPGLLKRYKSFNPALFLLFLFPFYFTYDLYTGKLFYSHGDYPGVYFPFRQWFQERLLNFEFPLWNPYWGAGHEAVVWATVPMDIYSLVDLFLKPHYEYYFLVHCMAIVMAGYYLFRKWDFDPWIAASISLLFYMSPLISHWSFEFINTNTFIAHMFVFFFMVKWFETGELRYVLFMGWAFFLGMFGTKLEFWFFEGVFFGLLSIIAFLIFKPGNPVRVFTAWAVIVTAIAAQAWQINLLVSALRNANRLGIPHGLHNLFSREMYRNLFLSLGDTELFPATMIGVLIYVGLNSKSSYRRYILWMGVLGAFGFKFWDFYFLQAFVKSPVFLGALIASFMIFRVPSKRHLLSTWVLFLLPAYYWCHKLENFDEAWMLKIAPFAFKLVWGFFVWLGCFQIHRYKVVQLGYLTVLLVLFLENQGQIVLSYLLGIVWIGGRDNFLMDFSFILVAVFGTTSYFRFKTLLTRLAPFIIILSSFPNPLYILPSETVPGYTNPMLAKGLSYNHYTGIPVLGELLKGWSNKASARVLAPDVDALTQGTFLIERVNNALFYGSMAPARYHDLVNFYGFNIKPEEHVAGYPSVFSAKTISRLPKTNTKGLTNGVIYYFTVWTVPPYDPELLRLLGVDHVITKSNRLSEPAIFQGLKLIDYKKNAEFNSAKLSDTLPRAFVATNVTQESLKDFQENMRPHIELGGDKDSPLSVYTAQPARIMKYDPEYVAVRSEFEGYLVLTDVFHPYWTARIDGSPAEIIPAFHAFRAVKVPAGSHNVEFICSVPYFKLAFFITFATVTFCLIGTYFVCSQRGIGLLRNE